MTELKRILLLTENDKLRSFIMPLSQWLELHVPMNPIDGLEQIHSHNPDLFLLDAKCLSPMVQALLTTIRNLPRYQSAPLIIIGESHQTRCIAFDHQVTGKLNLRRIEKTISELLQIRLVGRGSHGPHHGSIY